MVSPMLETSYQWGNDRDPFKAALQFPSLVATELERTKQYTTDAMLAAERFAVTEYLSTLAGPKPTGEKAREFFEKIAKMTGLAVEDVAKTNGYVREIYLEQLRKQGVQVSNYDATFTITGTGASATPGLSTATVAIPWGKKPRDWIATESFHRSLPEMLIVTVASPSPFQD